MEPEVIHEDEHIVAINKPAGLVVHGGVGTQETLVDWILEKYPEMKGVGEQEYDEDGNPIVRPGIVHRLDKETTGVLLLAKTQETFDVLKKHFQKGRVQKEYHAFVYGKPKQTRGIVNLPIAKSKSDFRKRSVLKNSRGERREAKTEYILSSQCEEDTSFMKFFPHTGRTHQIRVHAQAIQAPIVCDSLYASSKDARLGFSRLALHAYRITIQLHFHDEPMHIVAPYPQDFENAMKMCKETN